MSKSTPRIIPADEEHGINEETACFKITAITDSGRKLMVIGSVSKKLNGWRWHGLGRVARTLFPDHVSAMKAAIKAFGPRIQFEEVIS